MTAQSAKIISRPSGNSIRKNDDGVRIPSCSPIARLAASITRFVGLSAPATIVSARPVATIAAARINGLVSMRLAIFSFRLRFCTKAATISASGSIRAIGSAISSFIRRSAADLILGSSSSGRTTRAFVNRASLNIFCMTDMYASVYRERSS